VRVVKIALCPITNARASFLTANSDVIKTLPIPQEEKTEETGTLF